MRRLLKQSILVAAVVAAPVAAALAVELGITKTDDQAAVWPGQQLTYIITVTNGGPDTATDAVVTDMLPSGLENAHWSSSTTGAATAAPGSGEGDLIDTVTIPAGDMIIYTVQAFVAGDAAGTLANTATVAAAPGVDDVNLANNTATDEDAVQEEPVANVRPVYANTSPTQNAFAEEGVPPANGAAAFGGHTGDRSAPDQARYLLRSSSFGQPLARFRASPTHTEDTIEDARSQLFYLAGAPSEQNNAAAFRYITTFFHLGNTGALDGIQMRLDNSLPYDASVNPNDGRESDEERALRVARDVIEALRFEPYNKDLRQLLLDIYYYRTLGRQIAAKDQVVRAYQLNFSTELSEQEPFGGAINKEIAAFTTAAQALTGVLDPYRELLLDPLGVRISEFDAGYGGALPFGYYLFQQEVPYRSVYAATFVNYDADTGFLSGDPAPVDLGDSPSHSVLYVAPSAFNVDADGHTSGSADAAVTFTISNVGTGPLRWEASIDSGVSADMLSFQPASERSQLSASGDVVAGSTSRVTVHLARNMAPLLRVGTVRVTDVGTGSRFGLVYDVVVVQAANPAPIIQSSVGSVVQRVTLPFPATQDHQVEVYNAGLGTLNWTATSTADWFTIKGANESSFGTVATGTNYGRIAVRINAWADNSAPAQITISGSDPATAPVVVDVYFSDNPPPAAAAKTADLLLVYPEEILVARQAVTRNFAVLDGAAFPWTAAVTQGAPWLSIASANQASGLVALNIAANAGTHGREGIITVTGTGTDPATRTVIVRQGGVSNTAFNVVPRARSVSATAGTAVPGVHGTGFAVSRVGTGNLTWTARVVEGQDWLSIVSGASGANAGEIRFSYDLNPRTEGRTGTILVTSPEALEGHDRIEVQVIQDGTSGAAVLTAGFKDLALLFDVMRDEAQVKKELAKRYALRNLRDDWLKANELIAETITGHTAALADLGGIIPGWRALAAPNSDLLAKYFGWQQAVAELNSTKDFINGDANVLGFQTDFLFLVQNFPGQSPDLFDSFDKLMEYLYAGENDTQALTSPVGYAHSKYMTARAEYDTYLNTQDEIREELRTQNLEHRKWMFDTIGVDPGNDVDHPADAERYRNPGGNYGSRIWQQERSIDRAAEGLRQNAAQLQNIYNQINTELWRRGQETQINARIGDVYITYGDKLASIEEQIGAINAAQAFANQMAELTNAEDAFFSAGASIAARLANAVAQAAAETGKGFLEGDKHQLAAQENQAVRQLEDQILGVNSRALIANLYGEASVIGVASSELALAMAQEVAARQALLDEWHYRESLMRENNQALLGRSFADPVHRLRMRRAMIEAEASFAVAQRWVFFTIRALEYKWNTPFVHANPAGEWSMDSVFRSRTAKDLIDLMAAVNDFDGLMQGSARSDDRFDWFSFRDDFMGLTPVYDTDRVTELRVYAHPLTGRAATATEVFQARLEESFDPSTGIITLTFNTFKDNGETFFRGPRRDPDNPQVVLSRGQYLDKIVWMKVNLLGDFSGSAYQRVMGALTYSGGSFLRNARVGHMPDPARPDRIVDEFDRWSTRFWFYDSGMPQADPPVVASWRASDEQTTEIALNLTTQPREEMPDSVSRIDVFQERSVACDRWILKIFAAEGGVPRVNVDDIEDIEILFYHVSKDRPALKKGEDES